MASLGKMLDHMRDVIVPKLRTDTAHKGSHGGKIAIVGGSSVYTGAPFFAAYGAARAGADLVHVFTEASCASAIKSRSGDLCTHAVWDETEMRGESAPRARARAEDDAKRRVRDFRVDAVVVGPGLGQLDPVRTSVGMFGDVTTVFDADAFRTLTDEAAREPNLARGDIATPNKMELWRMLRNDSMESPFGSVKEIDLENVEHREIIARELASRFRTLSVLVKGETDYLFIPFIPNGIATRALTRPEFLEFGDDSVAVEYDIFVDDEQSEWDAVCVRLPFRGAPKRCGGQGDILSGVLAVFLMWARRTEESNLTDGSADYIASKYADYIAAVAAACYLVKASARAAYVELGRSMQAEDVLARVASQFSSRLEPDQPLERIEY